MMTSLKVAILLAAVLALPGAAFAATAVATRPASIHANNVPLALPPYGYTPGFWGYGGTTSSAITPSMGSEAMSAPRASSTLVETQRRGLFGSR